MGGRLTSLWLVLAVALLLAGCGAPQYTYVTDTSANTVFEVPGQWHKLSDAAIASVVAGKRATRIPSGLWAVGFDGAAPPAAAHATSIGNPQPFAFAMIMKPNTAMRNAMSYDVLRNFFFPVTAAARQSQALQGVKLPGFRLLHDAVLTPGHGVHGVRVTFQYGSPGPGATVYDQVALTNADSSQIYILLVHCRASCYRQDHSQINTVMSSFTVRS